jgi:hypothetical protein
MTLKRLAFLFCILVFAASTYAQTTQDPQALALATQAMAAMAGMARVNDVTLIGTATRTAGSDIENGNITLKALGTAYSRYDLNATGGTRSDVRNLTSSGAPQGYWTGPDGSTHAQSMHNCATDSAWFAPHLSILSQLSNPNLVVSYVGRETKAGVAVQHLHFAVQHASVDPKGLFQSLSSEDVYLDAVSLLPVAIAFNTHPDNDAGRNIPVEIQFSNYRSVSGAQIPFHVQKFLNGTLFLDLDVQSAVLNSGLQPSDF